MDKKQELAKRLGDVKKHLDNASHELKNAQDNIDHVDEPLFNEAVRKSISNLDLDSTIYKIFSAATNLSDFEAAARGKEQNIDLELSEDKDGNLEWDTY